MSADHTIGTMPNPMIRITAGPANAHPARCSECRMRRALTGPGRSSLGRHREETVARLGGLVERGLRRLLPLDRGDQRLPERGGDPRVLRDLRPRLHDVVEVL